MKCPYCDYVAKDTREDLGEHLILAHPYDFDVRTATVPNKIIWYVQTALRGLRRESMPIFYTVAELISALQAIEDKNRTVISADTENGYNAGIRIRTNYSYNPSAQYHTTGIERLSEDDIRLGLTIHDVVDGKLAIVLEPVY